MQILRFAQNDRGFFHTFPAFGLTRMQQPSPTPPYQGGEHGSHLAEGERGVVSLNAFEVRA